MLFIKKWKFIQGLKILWPKNWEWTFYYSAWNWTKNWFIPLYNKAKKWTDAAILELMERCQRNQTMTSFWPKSHNILMRTVTYYLSGLCRGSLHLGGTWPETPTQSDPFSGWKTDYHAENPMSHCSIYPLHYPFLAETIYQSFSWRDYAIDHWLLGPKTGILRFPSWNCHNLSDCISQLHGHW